MVNTPTPARTARRSPLIPILVALLVAAVIGGLVWYVLAKRSGNGEGERGSRRPPVTVGVATAEQQAFPVVLEALGSVTPVATSTVRAQVAGVIQQILFSEGQMVQKGQLLAVIDPRPFEIALMQATGQLKRDEAQLENARVTEKRYRTLLAQDSIAQQDVDSQAALVKQLEGTVNIDRAAERSAKLNLEFSRIAAPISGRIGLRTIDIGNLVGPGDANGIVTITQVAPIDVAFTLPQDRIPELRAALTGSRAPHVIALDRARASELASGRFLALDNQVDPQTGTVRAKARFDNAKSTLFPNQFVNVRVNLRSVESAISVPVSAIRRGAGTEFVYVLDTGSKTVAVRNVKTGLSAADKVQVMSGLAAGEQVITEGADRLADGAKVRLPGEGRGAADGKGGGAGDGKGGLDRKRGK
jgi:multidrug efflux system membrane fusion protein